MAVDYSAGSGRRGAYANLAKALNLKLQAQNNREAEDQRRRGLFGTGITQEHLSGMANTGLAIAEFGDRRRTQQMDRAEKSFERRMGGMQKRFDYYNERAKKGGTDEDFAMARGLMDAMNKERHNFEKANQKYMGKGLFGSSFGGDPVDYTGANTEKTERGLIARAMRNYGKQHGALPNMPQPNMPRRTAEEIADEEAAENAGGGMMAGVTMPTNMGPSHSTQNQPGAMPTNMQPSHSTQNQPGAMPTNIGPSHSVDPASSLGHYALYEDDPEYIAKYGRRRRPKAWRASNSQMGGFRSWEPQFDPSR